MDPTSTAILAGQTLIAGFEGSTTPPAELTAALRRGHLAGAVLFKRNVGTPQEVQHLLLHLARAAPAERPAALAVDQEGGRVARLKAPVLELPPMRQLGRIDDVALTWRAAHLLGEHLRALGFSLDFAPVLDVDTNPANPVIGDRSFGSTPDCVIRHGLAFAEGLQAAGIAACGKHFPGHGDTDVDSHLALPKLSHDMARLQAVELAPFAAARGRLASIMTAHVVFDAVDAGRPATLSGRALTGLLRGELAYDGLIISDDLDMKAVADHWGVGEAACLAVSAGCDVVLVCGSLQRALQAHEALVRRAERDASFSQRLRQAAERSLALRRRFPPPRTPRELRMPASDALQNEIRTALRDTAATP